MSPAVPSVGLRLDQQRSVEQAAVETRLRRWYGLHVLRDGCALLPGICRGPVEQPLC
jgi:hypothetical protein